MSKERASNNFGNWLPLLLERAGVRRIKCSRYFMHVPKLTVVGAGHAHDKTPPLFKYHEREPAPALRDGCVKQSIKA